MKYVVYILQSTVTGSYYVGHTADLETRLRDHNTGQVGSTKPGKPWKVVYVETHSTRSEAIIRERKIKSRKKRAYIESLIHRGVAQPG